MGLTEWIYVYFPSVTKMLIQAKACDYLDYWH